MHDISVERRLEINAVIDRLVADGNTFDAADAEELISKLPLSARSSLFQIDGRWQGTSSQQGYAAGHGQATIEDEEEKSLRVGKDRRWRIGGYQIDHVPGMIEISLLWVDTLDDASGKVCRLTYERASKRPVAMYLARDLSFSIGRMQVTYWRVFDP